MVNYQFQDEPALATNETAVATKPHLVKNDGACSHLHDASAAEVASLLLGLKLRGWLDPADREFLGRLGSEQIDWFVVSGKVLLHATNKVLFPVELLDPARNQGGEAMFRHRFYPSGSHPGEPWMIATANLDTIDGVSLMIGFRGPEHVVSRPDIESHFDGVVSIFRSSLTGVLKLLKTVHNLVTGPVPAAVVNRSTGRMVYLNEQAAALAEFSPKELVGLEFQEIKQLIPSFLSGGGLKIDDVNSDELSLSIVSAIQKDGPSEGTNAQIADFVLHEARNKLTTIMTAAGYMETMASGVTDSDGTPVTGIILDEADELNRWLYRLNLILDYRHLSKVPIDILASLGRSLRLFGQMLPGKLGALSLPELAAPPDALEIMFEAVLRMHLVAASKDQTPVVRLAQSATGRGLVLHFATNIEAANCRKRSFLFWRSFATKLANNMKIKIDSTFPGNDKLQTSMTIK